MGTVPTLGLSVAMAVLLAGCFEGGTDLPDTRQDNVPPIAQAGADRTVFALSPVTLDGAASSDADGDPLRYAWAFVSRPAGSTASLSGATTSQPAFTPDVVGSYTIKLTVDDRFTGGTDDDTIVVTATAPPPTANAGNDQSVSFTEPGVTVQLSGSGSDPLGQAVTFAWQIQGFVPSSGLPPSSPVTLTGATTATPSFDVAEIDQLGQYTLRLTVTSGSLSAIDDVIITVAAIPAPTANAGPDQQVTWAFGGVMVQLDGSGSSDPSNLPLTYSWQILSFQSTSGNPPGTAATLVGPTTVNPTFDVTNLDQLGTYTLQLTVSNGTLSATDQVTVQVAKSFPAGAGLLGSGVLAGLGAQLRRRWRRASARQP